MLVRWDKDNTETFVKRIELRYEDMAEAHLFFYQPDSELEFITLNQTAIANRNMEELQAKERDASASRDYPGATKLQGARRLLLSTLARELARHR